MAKSFLPTFTDAAQLQSYQLEGLKWTVNHAYNGSQHYRRVMDEVGVGPNDIQSLDDLRKLPFTSADDLRAGYPFPLSPQKYFYGSADTCEAKDSFFHNRRKQGLFPGNS